MLKIFLIFTAFFYNSNNMDYPFIQGISDIQQTEFFTGSRTTLALSPRSNGFLSQLYTTENHQNQIQYNSPSQHQDDENSPDFSSLRDYAQKTLASWGLKLGYLPQNYQNRLTINCFMQLISQKFSDQENREELKKLLAQTTFQRNKYQSLLQQQRTSVNQKNRTIGKLQNTINQLKAKMKQLQMTTKKEKDQDKKMISMLKSKNQQILHQVKKKQQETLRIKEQMKKNVGEKGPIKYVSFQVYQVFKKEEPNEANDKLEAVTTKYQNQRKNLMKENLLLRQKLYDIRQQIVSFAEWIDENIFRQPKPNYKNKLLVNHNLLFKKQSIVTELNQILSDAKNGIKQIITMHEQNRKTLEPRKSQKNISMTSYFEQNQSPNKLSSGSKPSNQDFKKTQPRQTMPTLKKSVSAFDKMKGKSVYDAPPLLKKKTVSLKPEFEINDEEQQQLSMISYVSTQEIVADNQKFDKWDILFNHQ